jgi:hypothetical protein
LEALLVVVVINWSCYLHFNHDYYSHRKIEQIRAC